jgi:hypothetical protein
MKANFTEGRAARGVLVVSPAATARPADHGDGVFRLNLANERSGRVIAEPSNGNKRQC